MERTDYRETDRNEYVVYKEAKFKCDITGEVSTFIDIINRFKDYRFTEHLDSLREEFNCQSQSHIIYYLIISYKRKGLFFGRLLAATLGIPDRNETDFLSAPIRYERENTKEEVNDILKNKLYDSVRVVAEMDIKFYIHRSLDIMDQYQEEVEELYDDGEDEGYHDIQSPPVAIETPFVSDSCSICLTAKPNIVFFPCLHQSVCSECEEVGKLLKCLVCREKIERKVKI